VFIVTGGGSGIGQALAHALAVLDKDVLIVGRQEHSLKNTASYSSLIQYVSADVSTLDGRHQVYDALKDVKKIDALIHNAGVIDPIVPLSKISEDAFQRVMSINLEAPLFLTQLLQDKLIGGRVLHIGSGAAHFPVAGWGAYCVSKAALSMLTRCWQLESNQIAVASVMPGIIDTAMQAQIRAAGSMDADKVDFFKRLYHTKQLIQPETVARFLCWLLLDVDASHYVSKEWDIYDESHHAAWLRSPQVVPRLEE